MSGETTTPNTYEIYVKTLSGKALRCTVTEKTTFGQVKQMVFEKNGTSVTKQKLIYMGKNVEDNDTLKKWDIGQDKTIHLVFQLPGGY